MPSDPSVEGMTRSGISPPGQRRATSGVLAVSLISSGRYSALLQPRQGPAVQWTTGPGRGLSGVGHGEDVEGGVQLLLGELALLDVAPLHHDLADRLLLGQ